jgi:hypothetical protein
MDVRGKCDYRTKLMQALFATDALLDMTFGWLLCISSGQA